MLTGAATTAGLHHQRFSLNVVTFTGRQVSQPMALRHATAERRDRACDLYVVCRGELEAIGAAGERLGAVKAGECFGEMALLMGQPRSTAVRAVTPCSRRSRRQSR